jgi:cyclomaltodextrinase
MVSVETPDWVRDAVFYQIFPDRFARSSRVRKPSNLEPWDSPPTANGFKGGDLLGIAERLDYLQDLGISAILLNPVFQSAANHRYHTHDYYTVDPILGGNRALRELLDEAHVRGMRVVLDGVFNHASRGFFQFSHIAENGPASPYVDWFIVNNHPLRPYHAPQGQHGYAAWWNMPALPKLNVATPAVRDFLWDVACHWIEFGADGWRLDVPADIDDDSFWREFRRRVKDVNPDAYIVGEIWHDAQRWLQGDQFDAVMNYLLTRACLGFFAGASLLQAEAAHCGYNWIEPLDAQSFAAEVQRLLDLYARPVNEVQLNLLGSHDTPRFKTLARGDSSAYHLALLFLTTVPGAPCLYYGDEIGLLGKHDPDCRAAFPWDEGLWDRELCEYVRKCITLRRAKAALRRGDFRWLLIGDQVLSYARRFEDQTMIVLLNNDSRPATIDLPVHDYLAEGAMLQDVWVPATMTVSQGQLHRIQVPARSGVVLEIVRNTA